MPSGWYLRDFVSPSVTRKGGADCDGLKADMGVVREVLRRPFQRQRGDLRAHGGAEAFEEAVDDLLGGIADNGLAQFHDLAGGAALGSEHQIGLLPSVAQHY